MALKSASQLRVVPGAAIGLDLGACLALANALGYDLAATTEMMSAMEPAIIGALNARLASGRATDMTVEESGSSRRPADLTPEQRTQPR